MRLFLLLTLFGVLQASDPCANCTLIPIMADGPNTLCGDFGTNKASALQLSSDSTTCYLHVTGCDLWNFVANGVCFFDNFNTKVLVCNNGHFSIKNPDNSFTAIDSMRCI